MEFSSGSLMMDLLCKSLRSHQQQRIHSGHSYVSKQIFQCSICTIVKRYQSNELISDTYFEYCKVLHVCLIQNLFLKQDKFVRKQNLLSQNCDMKLVKKKELLSWPTAQLIFFLGVKLFCLSRQAAKNFKICLKKDFIKPHKISAHSDNLETCLNELNELNFSEVSRNSLSNRC